MSAPRLEKELTREEQDIARRWCVLNCWGWPDDVPFPPLGERHRTARALMAKAVKQIGYAKCLLFWNSDDFDGSTVVKRYSTDD